MEGTGFLDQISVNNDSEVAYLTSVGDRGKLALIHRSDGACDVKRHTLMREGKRNPWREGYTLE